ncbi:hypothetical protein PoB_000410600 [Plakobranchus ocellatus]|uniref:Uncharacterized protein n=1 Tax=Plakobranchus ocellatus TaxID=259542 RepID=A0AAV3XNP3_9GAST|nr:hypothetical protein PoB_000410600 [Plakobranchus ocellatus]
MSTPSKKRKVLTIRRCRQESDDEERDRCKMLYSLTASFIIRVTTALGRFKSSGRSAIVYSNWFSGGKSYKSQKLLK